MNEKKKILFISTKSAWGGAQRYIVDLIDNLSRTSFDIEVAAGGMGPLAQKIRERDVPYHQIPDLEKNINLLKDFFSFFAILKILRKTRPDVLHLNSSKASILGAIAGRLLGIQKIVSSTHGWPFLEDRPLWQRILIKLLTKIGALFQDTVICVSQFDYDIGIHAHIASSKKLVPIHNGIDPSRHPFLERSRARESLFKKIQKEPKNYFIIGSIAEYTKNKGLFYLIEAAAHIVIVEPRTIFFLIGWGEEKQFLEHEIARLHLEKHVFLIEYLPEAFSYLKALDIFILPSIKEGFAYTLLEASLAELPIIATRVGGNPEVIENLKNGLLIRPASPEEIIYAVSYLMRAPEERVLFGGEARKKVVRDFSISKMVGLTADVYRGE